ncbi:unnamed protein product [Acanthoscelides obtectus]|uniref:Uncharacterized protein n=1 Tax=Acanthoscelides obtectus TaxID=200917 RepID=A0A9P0KPR3_ACAOB|nr:unnamed protein product [Acanthoscelides obtectus]CAK1657222.1 hypothetical protein AOBTE_LOCUS20220 [Acanthoscelides obtectus]
MKFLLVKNIFISFGAFIVIVILCISFC